MIRNAICGLFLQLIVACYGQPAKKQNDVIPEVDTTHSQSSSPAINNFEIEEYNIVGDTLKIVSTADFLYYPFGSYTDEKTLAKQFSFMKKSVEYSNQNREQSEGKLPLYRFSLNHSYTKFLYDEEKGRMELIAAKITDREVILSNQVKIGMTKADFIGRFSNQIKPEQIKSVKVIEFISGLLGIWHFYNFDNDILISFYITTDYQLDKN
ncbi:MAG: hypothetical protein ACKV1O_25495 [Saprospiraceae bacterium]